MTDDAKILDSLESRVTDARQAIIRAQGGSLARVVEHLDHARELLETVLIHLHRLKERQPPQTPTRAPIVQPSDPGAPHRPKTPAAPSDALPAHWPVITATGVQVASCGALPQAVPPDDVLVLRFAARPTDVTCARCQALQIP